jgi:ABC-type dipeptide/oligopeptide/nickel transport system permease component
VGCEHALRYAVSRLLLTVAVLLAVTLVVFALTEMVVPEVVLDRAAGLRYATWLRHLARGDLGQSLQYRQAVATLIGERLPVTTILAFSAMALALLLALPLGILAPLRPGGPLDRIVSALAVTGQALPSFWTGLMLIVLFGATLGWLPMAGTESWRGYVLPSVTLALFTLPVLLRKTRAGMIDVLASDYVRAARARGLRPASVVLRHALRNAVMPLVTVVVVELGCLFAGSIVTEQVFAMPGIGYLAWQAILVGDTAIIQAVVLLLACGYAALTLAADLLTAVCHPRLRPG